MWEGAQSFHALSRYHSPQISMGSPTQKLSESIPFEILGRLHYKDTIVHIIQSVNSVAQSYLTLCYPMDCSTPGLPVHHQLPKFSQTHVHWVGDAIQLSHPLLLPPSIFPSIRIFSNESVLPIRWLKYWSFRFSISPSNEYSGLISFRMDWLDLLAVQGTLKSLHQYHSSKASILQRSAFFIVQLSHSYMTTGKTELWLDETWLAK